MSELLHLLEFSFDRGPQSIKAIPPPANMPSVLTTRPWPVHQNGLAPAVWYHTTCSTTGRLASCAGTQFRSRPQNRNLCRSLSLTISTARAISQSSNGIYCKIYAHLKISNLHTRASYLHWYNLKVEPLLTSRRIATLVIAWENVVNLVITISSRFAVIDLAQITCF